MQPRLNAAVAQMCMDFKSCIIQIIFSASVHNGLYGKGTTMIEQIKCAGKKRDFTSNLLIVRILMVTCATPFPHPSHILIIKIRQLDLAFNYYLLNHF